MQRLALLKNWLLFATILFGIANSGCTPLRLPAIDPSGQSLFLPKPNYTTVATPFEGQSQYGCVPTPVYTQPPPVPACEFMPPSRPTLGPTNIAQPVATPAPTALPGQERLIMTPTRMVAPINSEVVLMAGVADTRGTYISKRPVEWVLSQDSVGHFVDVGERGRHDRHHLHQVLHGGARTRKVTGSYALTRTSNAARRITRGTPSPQDDVWLNKGQSWLSLTSATEGVSYVTAIATGGSNWDERRKIARVHWVDVQWALPGPAVAPAGQPHLLTTTVSRASTGRPAPNWSVRYEVTGGMPASFAPNGQTVVEVPSGSAGQAAVQLVPAEPKSGSTQVRIDILAPESADGTAPIAVGQGWVTLSWSAPGLEVRVQGPPTLALNGVGTYRVQVTNPGDLVAQNVRISTRIPQNLALINANPTGQILGNVVEWTVGALAPGQTAQYDVTCRALREGEVRFQASATGDNLAKVAEMTTRVAAPSLEIRVIDAPQVARIGDKVHFNVEVGNIGRATLTNVFVRDRFDAGLEHTFGEPSPIERTLGQLRPSQVSRFGISFFVRKEGRLCHTLEVAAAGGHFVSKEVCVEVTRPTLGLNVTKSGPDNRKVGEKAEFTIEVTNTGNAPLTKVQILNLPSESLVPQLLSPEYRVTPAGLVWQIEQLQPQQSIRKELVCDCATADPEAISRVRVSTAEGLIREAESRTAIESEAMLRSVSRRRVRPDAAEKADLTPGADAETKTKLETESSGTATEEGDSTEGKLMVSLTSSSSRSSEGTQRYFVVLKNARDVADQHVRLRFWLPAGATLRRFKSDSAALRARTTDGNAYECDAIAEIRPQGVRQFTIEIESDQPISQTLRVEVDSRRAKEPVKVEKSTKVAAAIASPL